MSFVAQVIQKDLAVVKDDTGRIVATCVLHGGLSFTPAALAQFAQACESAQGTRWDDRSVVYRSVRQSLQNPNDVSASRLEVPRVD